MKSVSANFLAKAVTETHPAFKLRQNLCVVQNVSWGLFSWGEADLISLSKSGYLYEGEIKISKEDFLKDKDKKKFNKLKDKWESDIKYLYYIVPDYLYDFVSINTDYSVISIDTEYNGFRLSKQKSGKGNIGRKLFIEEQLQLARLGSMRAWRFDPLNKETKEG